MTVNLDVCKQCKHCKKRFIPIFENGNWVDRNHTGFVCEVPYFIEHEGIFETNWPLSRPFAGDDGEWLPPECPYQLEHLLSNGQ